MLKTSVPAKARGLKRIWWMLIVPPIVFFVVIVLFSGYFGVITRGDAQAIAERTQGSIPYILIVVQIVLLVFVLRALKADGLTFADIGWQIPTSKRLWLEVGVGACFGVALGLLYIFVLSPLLEFLQRSVGDFVPPGRLLGSLGSAVVPFFVANVLLAPFVEESIYRGYAFMRLRQQYGDHAAVILTCVCFGLLHWAGGFWYIVLTALVAGGMFAALVFWRRSIVVAFAAHLALNVVEFVFVWLSVSNVLSR
jgi:uncharacterized protein